MSSGEIWGRLASYAASHHGVVGSAYAKRQLGATASQLHWFERSGRLKRVAREAYVVVGSPQTWHQRARVATVSSHGWLSHAAAAALWGLEGFPPRRLDVLTLHGSGRDRKLWSVHETRRLSGVDLGKLDGIPCTWLPRTIIDLAAVSPPDLVARALDDACRRRPDMLETITTRFLELAGRGRRGTTLMRQLLAERHGSGRFTQSSFEAATLRLVRAFGLPPPVPQHPVTDGRFRAYLDLGWPDILWAVECDSLLWHSGKHAHEWDRKRRRKLKALGWDLVEVTFDDVARRPDETGEQLRVLYRKRVESLRQLAAIR